MLHENEGRTNIFKADHFFQTKMVRGTDIFSETFGPRTVISGTNFPVTGQYIDRCSNTHARTCQPFYTVPVSMGWGVVKWPQYALCRWPEHEMYPYDAGLIWD